MTPTEVMTFMARTPPTATPMIGRKRERLDMSYSLRASLGLCRWPGLDRNDFRWIRHSDLSLCLVAQFIRKVVSTLSDCALFFLAEQVLFDGARLALRQAERADHFIEIGDHQFGHLHLLEHFRIL